MAPNMVGKGVTYMNDDMLKSLINNPFPGLDDFRVGDIVMRIKALPHSPARIPVGALGRVERVIEKANQVRVVTRGGNETITNKSCFRHATVWEVRHFER